MSEDETRMFKFLVQLEKRAGWDNLIKMRASLFFVQAAENEVQGA